ncbi:molybdopterin oxidoreductase, iron-sulfur binding subunit [Pseudomonas sp. M47T1]|uniref:TAT-variant-translocated molybdopterin oxidoreductase n=1 Tax=Pseudomonas sp. M47T1 TaxID=1179778 RepID=UPI00026072D8|nr:TAT-variant-translocated molybdopterin oxidoreductase [Pseudomonas sp. M47T1]EIK94794.1 molybdopterin oxidoreductase, iron-sulfur binding subunit [Pseudomonas sp. M47T1]
MNREPDLGALRQQLADARLSGEHWWRGLEALADSAQAQAWVAAEFPGLAPTLDRRRFLQLMAASLALAGLAACGQTPDESVPRVVQAESQVPGKTLVYATAVPFAGVAQPVLGVTTAGRPIKLEGNPDHPASGGTCDAFTQAAILQLYDPDRSQSPRYKGRETAWGQVQGALLACAGQLDRTAGDGLHVVLGANGSPTLQRQLQQLMQRWPKARLYLAEPFAATAVQDACRQVFGQPLQPRWQRANAEAVVSFDDDWLGAGPWQTVNQRGWAARRRAAGQGQGRAQVLVADSVPTLTSAAASERLRLAPSRRPMLLRALAAELGAGEPGLAALSDTEQAWVRHAGNALKARAPRCLVSLDSQAPVDQQALVLRLNEHLCNQGVTVDYIAPQYQGAALHDLLEPLAANQVQVLVMLDCNPVNTAPAHWHLSDAVQHVPLRIHAGLYHDESARDCHWHLPLSHALDGWADARAADGSSVIVQPLMAPLYPTRTLAQVVELLQGRDADAHAIVRQTWAALDDNAWQQALSRGWADPAPVAVSVTANSAPLLTESAPVNGLEVRVLPDPCVWDGRLANLGWLQELPKPISKLTWGNVIGVSPALAERLGLANGDRVRVPLPGQIIEGPAWVEPGQADSVVALYAGYGRQRAGRVGNGLGYPAQALGAVNQVATLERLDGSLALASTQLHHQLPPGHESPIRSVAPGQSLGAPELLFHDATAVGPQWGMVIDLDLCTGCNACVVACQAENNIAVVGPEQVAQGRAMHWLRIDHYYQGSLDAPRSHFQPLPCMHCEQAPCEVGCPVNATQHGQDGVNQMVYNRCIGTRTCASYCPYKVRRFNWLDYSADAAPTIQAQRNPQVTVRSRGVMEKCTYCVQRISAARIDSKIAGTDAIEVTTACQQSCPCQAISFGDIRRADSEVARARQSGRHYRLLEELDTRPRTTYLARIDEERQP